jgi:hypothetical protein
MNCLQCDKSASYLCEGCANVWFCSSACGKRHSGECESIGEQLYERKFKRRRRGLVKKYRDLKARARKGLISDDLAMFMRFDRIYQSYFLKRQKPWERSEYGELNVPFPLLKVWRNLQEQYSDAFPSEPPLDRQLLSVTNPGPELSLIFHRLISWVYNREFAK